MHRSRGKPARMRVWHPRAPRYGCRDRFPFTVGRGPVPRHRFAARQPHLCRAGSPDPDLFVIRRAQTTERQTHIGTMEIAGETRSDARLASEGPALRYNRNTAPTVDSSMSNRNPNSAIQPLPFQEMLHRPTAGNPRGNRLRPRIPP